MRKPRVRIVYDERSSFSRDLEDHARHRVSSSAPFRDDEPVKNLDREIALVLDQLERWRELHASLSRQLLRRECYVRTELTQTELRTPRYSPYRFPEREKLQRRLGEIDKERVQLRQKEEERVQELQRHLLRLLNDRATLY